jgi:predicted TIM-barrel fold metal-dependent hydrolase
MSNLISKIGIPVIDAHSHFFSFNSIKSMLRRTRTFLGFYLRKDHRTRTHTDIIDMELPLLPHQRDNAKRWVTELDKYGIIAMGVMVNRGAYNEFLRAQKRFPGRFIGYLNIDPSDKNSIKYITKAAKDGFSGIKLYPSTWNRMKVFDKNCYSIYEEALRHNLLVFLHFGITLGKNADLRNGNPIDLQLSARDFPELKFIIAHFGAGFFREALMMLYQHDNVYLDSSGSNSWMYYMPYELDLKQIFKKAIIAGGSKKILFGTDSTFFPRGWRFDILESQYNACKEILAEADSILSQQDLERIFYKNILELTSLT